MDVHVVIPWRPTESRMHMFGIVTDWLARDFPDWPVHLVDVDTEMYCLAGSRNLGVAQAQAAGADVVVIIDADTVVQSDVLAEAVEKVAREGGIVIPYDQYWIILEDGDERLRAGASPFQCHAIHYFAAVSGAAVTTPEAWWQVGGQDERFMGWGGEDNAFYDAASTLGTISFMPGRAIAGWHEHQSKPRMQYRKNFNLHLRYKRAVGSRKVMQRLVNEPHRFRHSLRYAATSGDVEEVTSQVHDLHDHDKEHQ